MMGHGVANIITHDQQIIKSRSTQICNINTLMGFLSSFIQTVNSAFFTQFNRQLCILGLPRRPFSECLSPAPQNEGWHQGLIQGRKRQLQLHVRSRYLQAKVAVQSKDWDHRLDWNKELSYGYDEICYGTADWADNRERNQLSIDYAVRNAITHPILIFVGQCCRFSSIRVYSNE